MDGEPTGRFETLAAGSSQPSGRAKAGTSYCEGEESVLRKIFCPQHGMVGAAGQQLSDETRNLLGFRLMVVAGVFALTSGLFALRSLILFEEEGFFLPQQVAVFGLFTLAAITLYGKRDFPLRVLRIFELLIFGTMVLHLFRFFFLWTIERSDSFGTVGIYRAALSFFAITVVYGMFVPNHWRRAIVVLSLIASGPGLLTFAAWLAYPGLRKELASVLSIEVISDTGLTLFLGAVVSALGSHIVYSMREGAVRMRELGMYRLKEQLGRGGMGQVWKAEHQLLTRPAAIKMIRPDLHVSKNGKQQDSLVSRFRREAQITATLSSPHTVQLYDFGVTEEGDFYYVMEYLDGLDLETWVERFGPLPPPRVVYLLQQAAESLAEAHQLGLIHRDIKPSNLHVSRQGIRADYLKLLDFGLVKLQGGLADRETTLTVEGTTTGTPAFMAPETALGKNQVDARSDIYSLGCVAYWLLTGHLVFEGETPLEMVVHHVKTPPLPPSKKTEIAIPKALERAVITCLSKNPDERPQSVEEFSEMLDRCGFETPWTQKQARAWWDTHLPRQV